MANAAFTLLNFRRELLLSLVEMNYQVTVICPRHCDLSGDANIVQEFRDLGVELLPIELQRNGLSPLGDLRFFWSLFRIIKSIAPDFVLNYTVKPTIYGSIASYLAGVRNIGSNITGLGYVFLGSGWKASFIRGVVKLQYLVALGCNRVVFFQNPDDLALFLKLRIISTKTRAKVLNGSGVNLECFYPSGPTQKIANSFIFVGRLLKDKGVVEYIEAARKIKAKYPKSVFKLLGAIDDNPSCISQVYLDLVIGEGIIEYQGPSADVRSHLAESEVFVLPSYREGTPRSVLEALAVGLPVITTDAPGCRETVIDGKNGFLIPVKDIDGLVNAMECLLIDEERRLEMGEVSLQLAREKYDVNIVNEQILCALL